MVLKHNFLCFYGGKNEVGVGSLLEACFTANTALCTTRRTLSPRWRVMLCGCFSPAGSGAPFLVSTSARKMTLKRNSTVQHDGDVKHEMKSRIEWMFFCFSLMARPQPRFKPNWKSLLGSDEGCTQELLSKSDTFGAYCEPLIDLYRLQFSIGL